MSIAPAHPLAVSRQAGAFAKSLQQLGPDISAAKNYGQLAEIILTAVIFI
jgi:hypothetical protein